MHELMSGIKTNSSTFSSEVNIQKLKILKQIGPVSS